MTKQCFYYTTLSGDHCQMTAITSWESMCLVLVTAQSQQACGANERVHFHVHTNTCFCGCMCSSQYTCIQITECMYIINCPFRYCDGSFFFFNALLFTVQDRVLAYVDRCANLVIHFFVLNLVFLSQEHCMLFYSPSVIWSYWYGPCPHLPSGCTASFLCPACGVGLSGSLSGRWG